MRISTVCCARTPYYGDAHIAPFTPAPAVLNLPTLWLLQKSERRALFCCECAPRDKPADSVSVPAGFSQSHEISFRQFEKKSVNYLLTNFPKSITIVYGKKYR